MDIIELGGTRHVVMECGTCGVLHTIPETKYNSCRRDGGFWYCPNGDSWGWKDGQEKEEMNVLRRERDRLKQDAARLQDEITAEKQRADRAENKVTQTKRRAIAGVCPCCTRTFNNVQRHMRSKHPNVTPLNLKAEAV